MQPARCFGAVRCHAGERRLASRGRADRPVQSAFAAYRCQRLLKAERRQCAPRSRPRPITQSETKCSVSMIRSIESDRRPSASAGPAAACRSARSGRSRGIVSFVVAVPARASMLPFASLRFGLPGYWAIWAERRSRQGLLPTTSVLSPMPAGLLPASQTGVTDAASCEPGGPGARHSPEEPGIWATRGVISPPAAASGGWCWPAAAGTGCSGWVPGSPRWSAQR